MRRAILVMLAIALLASMASLAAAQRSEGEKKSLRGLSGVFVLIETVSEDARRQGLDDNLLQTDAELRLRKANIHVATQTEMVESDKIGMLYINVGTTQLKDGLFVVCLNVDLQQSVRLVRDNLIIIESATVYRIKGTFGTFPPSRLRDGVRSSLNDKVDAFINDYLAMNQK